MNAAGTSTATHALQLYSSGCDGKASVRQSDDQPVDQCPHLGVALAARLAEGMQIIG